MRFGKTLKASIHEPWRKHYIDYDKLKKLMREKEDDLDESEWTERDESAFVEELINIQLEKVNSFHVKTGKDLKERTATCEHKLENIMKPSDDDGGDDDDNKINNKNNNNDNNDESAVAADDATDNTPPAATDGDKLTTFKEVTTELDAITKNMNELEKFSRVNYTGFLKAAKKHDRLRPKYKVRPLLVVRLSAMPFNSEDYSPLLYRISTMYSFIRQNTEKEQQNKEPKDKEPNPSEASTNVQPSKTYQVRKYWVHLDNLLEVKTYILRRLPVLIYNARPSKVADSSKHDPTITSLYFDNGKFNLYSHKLDRHNEGASLRLRWYGNLADRPEVVLERKVVPAMEDYEELGSEMRLPLKDKHIQSFITGENNMDKQIQKLKDRKSKTEEDVRNYETLVRGMQNFIEDEELQPLLRAVYTRTAFQIPGDDRVRISLDTDLVFIREDSLDEDRPCRNPDEWHRRDIDDNRLEYPFDTLRKGEISRFPYALLEIKTLQSLNSRSKEWISDLMNSHLVHEAPRFSKFVHGVAVLFEDYVNTFPFWVSDLDKDIRKDPVTAYEQEQEKMKKQAEDDFAIGSFTASTGTPQRPSGFNNRGSSQNTGSPHRFPDASPQRRPSATFEPISSTSPFASISNRDRVLPTPIDEEPIPIDDPSSAINIKRHKSPMAMFKHLFPAFQPTKKRRYSVHLPPGVQKPTSMIKDAGPLQVEAKVWLANQRTFIKWQHISILLASLSLGLYNAAGQTNELARGIGMAFTLIAVFAGIWGYAMYMLRSKWITQRSGKDFDNPVGPVIVCVALIVALIMNFCFKWEEVMADMNATELLRNLNPMTSFNRSEAMLVRQGA